MSAYALIKDDLNADDILHLRLLNNLGIIYHYKGEFERALTFYLKTIKLYEKAKKIDRSDYSVCLNNIGNLYDDIGQTKIAIQYLEKGLSVVNSSNNVSTATGLILHNLAFMYNTIGDYNQSLKFIEESLLHTEKYLGLIP